MRAQTQKTSGLNLNPLAPAQSTRTFAFTGKTRNPKENVSIPALFCSYCFNLFQSFSRKVEKEVQGRLQSHSNTPKWSQRHQIGGKESEN